MSLEQRSWTVQPPTDLQARAAAAIEQGAVLYLPELAFTLSVSEQAVFSIAVGGRAKNVSYTPATGSLGGLDARGTDARVVHTALARFSAAAAELARALFPGYAPYLQVGRASFRPSEIAGRRVSWRKDDTRLHVDSFPSLPSGGRRILRIFTNVNPHGRPRTWRIGGPFVDVVARFRRALRLPWPGQAGVLKALHITKAHRTPYDSLMLQLHDCMKRDEAFQASPGQTTIDFGVGTTWLAFTDEVSHAAMAGQYQFEQTFFLPLAGMRDDASAPLRVLERAMERRLT